MNKIQMELASARVEHLKRKAEEEKNKPRWQRQEGSESSAHGDEVCTSLKLTMPWSDITCSITIITPTTAHG